MTGMDTVETSTRTCKLDPHDGPGWRAERIEDTSCRLPVIPVLQGAGTTAQYDQ